MLYESTRGSKIKLNSAEAIIKGIADDRGLYVPEIMPAFEEGELESLTGADYKTVAKVVIGKFFDDFTDEELDKCIEGAYDEKFTADDIVGMTEAGNATFLELYHGKTAAFKDMALSILPYLMTTSVKKVGEKNKICILTATSGDTGKAALEGFSDVEGTEIIVFFPDGGVSQIQRQQMITQEGKNTHVFAIHGNFDDAQTGVKQIFADEKFKSRLEGIGVKLSSANSINIGRLVPQVAYYVYSYIKMAESGKISLGSPINIAVPTGNFGNILAAYFAREMGVPVNKLICASNDNKVLTDFLNTGLYDIRPETRSFKLTNSPSMDILISSNLERLLYLLNGRNGELTSEWMMSLEKLKFYLTFDSPQLMEGIKSFYGGYATEDETLGAIKEMWDAENYLMDTHTAVCYKVYKDYAEATGDATPTLICSTASAYKFAEACGQAVNGDADDGLTDDSEMQSDAVKYNRFESGKSGDGLTDDSEMQSDAVKNNRFKLSAEGNIFDENQIYAGDSKDNRFKSLNKLYEITGVEIPYGLRDLNKREVRHDGVIDISAMKDVVFASLV